MADESSSDVPQRSIYAFTRFGINMEIVPADPSRLWMQQTDHNFANRCLPMRIANQAGWFIYTSLTVEVSWNGGDTPADLIVTEVHEGEHDEDVSATSHFGYGIVTWNLPVLFRTPPGVQLLARGPANWMIDGVSPLEGVVETDWSSAPFTMNWKMTRPGTVRFEAGTPICMLCPIQLNLIEELEPSFQKLSEHSSIAEAYKTWSEERSLLNERKLAGDSPKTEWSKDYFFGRTSNGGVAQQHKVRLQVKHFGWDE